MWTLAHKQFTRITRITRPCRGPAVPVVRHTGGLKDTVFDVDFDKARAAWEIVGSSDWERDGIDATNGFAFEVRVCLSVCLSVMCRRGLKQLVVMTPPTALRLRCACA